MGKKKRAEGDEHLMDLMENQEQAQAQQQQQQL